MAALPALSPDQTAAWDAAATVLARAGVDLHGSLDPADPDRVPAILAITGRAGSGKSLLLAQLTKALREAGVEIVSPDWDYRRKKDRRTLAILAPTNKAAAVLRAKGVPATTIHRILYTPVYDPEFERVAAWLAGEGDRPAAGQLTDLQLDRARQAYEQHGSVPASLAAAGLRGSDFITGWKRREEPLDLGFVDESSMLDDRALDDLREIFPTLLLFGDPAQLPPVQGQGTGAAMVSRSCPPRRSAPSPASTGRRRTRPSSTSPRPLPTRRSTSRPSRRWCARPRAATGGCRCRGAWTATSWLAPRSSCGATPRGSSSSTPSAPPMPRPRPSSFRASR
jgi:exodeoxyribonuclease-5